MTSPRELLGLIDKFKGTKVSVVGDLILDHYVWGSVDRISPEAPVVVVNVDKETHSLGGAANVANNLVSLGAEVSMFGAVARDEHGKQLRKLMEEQGINVEGVVALDDRPTTRKTRVMASVQQVVRIDRESVDYLPAAVEAELCRVVKSNLDSTAALVLSDYAKGVVTQGFCSWLSEESKRGRFGLGKTLYMIDPKDRNFSLYQGATVVKPNRKEAIGASGEAINSQAEAREVARKLARKWNSEMVLITLGAQGMALETQAPSDIGFAIDTKVREVFDVSGAGDTVSAVFTLALSAGGTPKQAAELANYAAGIVVATVGAVPVPLDELRAAVAGDQQ